MGSPAPQSWSRGMLKWCQTLAATVLVVCSCDSTLAEGSKEAGSGPPIRLAPGQPFYLGTDWYPKDPQGEDPTENRLFREIIRQSVLIAVREELGIVTRDESLGEQPDISANKKDEQPTFSLSVDLNSDGSWEAVLYGGEFTPAEPIWKHDGKIKFDVTTIYTELATQCAKLTSTITKKLRDVGLDNTATAADVANLPSRSIERQLSEMNFVSQFVAIRQAHAAIGSKGASPDWLGVLVRGYSHLALLTDHTWSSQSEVFAARSLVYAERMVATSDESHHALWHRAYARAIVGLHGQALEQLEKLSDEQIDDVDPPLGEWARLAEPFSNFDHISLEAVANREPQLRQLVDYLQWRLYHSYMHGRWIYEKGRDAAQSCPEAYGVYSVMANWPALKIKRMGSWIGISAFGSLLPQRVAALENLPKETSAAVAEQLMSLEDQEQGAQISPHPMALSRALSRDASSEQTPSECSWTILAQLIAEEQFVEAINAIIVSQDATEHSKEPLIDMVMPLIKEHRYASYVRSYRYPRGSKSEVYRMVEGMRVVDPRINMWRMYTQLWQAPLADQRTGNAMAWYSIWNRTYSHPGLLDVSYGRAKQWTSVITQRHHRLFANELAAVSPRSVNAVRFQWEMKEDLSEEQLKEFEADLKADPIGWMTLGHQYYGLNKLDAAIRCYRRSLEISPCKDATVRLADCYYYNDQEELWVPTLESYLEVEDLGLAHGAIHRRIANYHVNKRAWLQAEPHAGEAAQTYSAWGLGLASKVYEGMRDWKRSEWYVSEATKHYPSYSTGTEWYFWCRRTGQGDVDSARQFAQKNIEIASKSVILDDALRVFTFRILEGEGPEAIDKFEKQMERDLDNQVGDWDRAYLLLNFIRVCNEAGDETLRDKYCEELNEIAEEKFKETHENWIPLFAGLSSAFCGKAPDEEFFENFDSSMTASIQSYRTNYWYFLGAALHGLGDHQRADHYLGKAAFAQPFDRYCATLAGAMLVKKHGADRGGLPEDYEKQEQEAIEQAKESDTEDSNEEAEPVSDSSDDSI